MEKKESRGAKIKKERRDREWSREYLAKLAGCSASLILLIEREERPTSSYIVVIEKILGIEDKPDRPTSRLPDSPTPELPDSKTAKGRP